MLVIASWALRTLRTIRKRVGAIEPVETQMVALSSSTYLPPLTSRQPGGPVTVRMAASTASAAGDANTSPQTAAASMPRPTYPAWAGS